MTATTDAAPVYSIEEMAKRTGLTARTLRYYEELGLLPPARRTEGGYRLYNDDAIARIERIREMKDLFGYSLAQMQSVLRLMELSRSLREAGGEDETPAARLARVEEAQAILAALEAAGEARLARLNAVLVKGRAQAAWLAEEHERVRGMIEAEQGS